MKHPRIPTKLLLLASLLLLLPWKAQAQQEPMYSQYMFNALAINPAYAGSKDCFSASFLHRNQWLGIEGAPTTNTLSAHSPLLFPNSAVGGTLLHDFVGVTRRTSLLADYAYRIELSKTTRLAFGLRAGFSHFSWDPTRLENVDQSDYIYAGGATNGLAPRIGTGIFLHNRNFYAGLSIPNLLKYNPKQGLDQQTGLPESERHYFGTLGYAFVVSPNVVVKPSVLAKYEQAAPFQMDINMNVLFWNHLWIGASYRTRDAIVGMVEIIPIPMLQIGYAYDMPISELRGATNGTHEFVVTFNLGPNSKLKTPRYF